MSIFQPSVIIGLGQQGKGALNIYLFKVSFIYFKDTEKEREREISSTCWFFPTRSQWLGMGQAKARSQRLHPGFPCGLDGRGSGTEQAGLEPAL